MGAVSALSLLLGLLSLVRTAQVKTQLVNMRLSNTSIKALAIFLGLSCGLVAILPWLTEFISAYYPNLAFTLNQYFFGEQ